MAEIIKTYKEHLPALRFIGKRYTEADRLNGGFGHKWGEWFQNRWFEPLEILGDEQDIENGYIGFMRYDPEFEYWIGAFCPKDTEVPDGYDYIDIDESDAGICWIKGKDDGSIYAMHEECIESLKENGIENMREFDGGNAYFFERYNCPRFTKEDSDGNIILDYGVYLAD